MIKAFLRLGNTLFSGTEKVTGQTIEITTGSLDLIQDEIDLQLEINDATREIRIQQGIEEAKHELEKTGLRLKADKSALEIAAAKEAQRQAKKNSRQTTTNKGK